MKGTLTEIILRNHITEGELKPGQEIGIRVDDVLIPDSAGTIAWPLFEMAGVEHVKANVLSIIDIGTLQVGPDNANNNTYLESVAQKYGAFFSRAGNGIRHRLYLEGFASPGKVMVGCDSLASIAGGMGVLAFSSGGLDAALVMAGQPYRFEVPNKIRGINLKGKLNSWVTPYDAILHLAQEAGTNNNGCIFEYFGDGVKTLNVPERATIAGRGIMLGAIASIFPSDEETKEFLRGVGRVEQYRDLAADSNAKYSDIIELNLSKIEPMVVLPPEQGKSGLGKIAKLDDVIGIKVDQVCIGGCNTSYHDLYIVSEVLFGKKIPQEVDLIITPSSKTVSYLIGYTGVLSSLVEAGARITESSCGPCMGQGGSPKSGGVSARTHIKNYSGRCGTPDAEVYLVSPEVAAATAITGKLSDPREMFKNITYKKFNPPIIQNVGSLFTQNKEGFNVNIVHSPNISNIPQNTEFADSLNAEATIKVRNNITIDDITPGDRTRFGSKSNIPVYAKLVFSGIDSSFYERAFNNKQQSIANLVIAGDNYGQGSTSDYAAIYLMYLGVKAVIAKSFNKNHANILANHGVMPLIFKENEDYQTIDKGDVFRLDNIHKCLRDNNLTLCNEEKDVSISLACDLNPRQIEIVLKGGALNYYNMNARR